MTARAVARETKVPSGTIARPLAAHVKSEAEDSLSAASQKASIAALPGTREAEREADTVASRATASERERSRDQQPRFDFSSVRVHDNALSPSESRAVNASAIAIGRDIYFAEGRFAPNTPAGRSLLAHELTHVVQQARSGINLPQRKTPDEEIDEDLKKQVGSNTQALDPNNEEYARTLQQLGFNLTHDQQMALLTKPAKAAEVAAWELRFKKAGILADRILKAGTKVTDKDSRASNIAQDLADAGFFDKAMEIAGKITDDQKKYVYTNVLKQPSAMPAAHAATITQFYAAASKAIADHPVATLLMDHTGDYGKALGTEKLKAVLDVFVTKYGKDPDFVELMSHVFVFNTASRPALASWLTSQGKGDVLYKILRGPFFADEDQDNRVQFEDKSTNPSGVKSLSDADKTWAVAEKQKYLVDRIVTLASAQKITITKPANMQFATIRTWLDANTEKIGQALSAGSADDAAQMYRDMADAFFWHIPPNGADVKPDLKGKVGKLQEGDPQKSRLKSDCDVLASYAMRLLTSSGLTPVGYMAIKPPPGRDGHAMALMMKGTTYYAVSNKTIEKIDPAKAKTLNDALRALRDYGIDEAYGDPKPDAYEVYWSTSANGDLDQKLVDADASLERKDLEPKSP